MKLALTFFLLLVTIGYSENGDPRSVSLVQIHGIAKDQVSAYRRPESGYSIVVYGAHDLTGDYRILGIDRTFKIGELTALLNTFYAEFPAEAVLPDKRLGGAVPLPNILYASGGWNETKPTGRSLMEDLSKTHGVALYYFELSPAFTISPNRSGGEIPSYQGACIQYYQKLLQTVVERMKISSSKTVE